jgi:hypothetical protein
VYIPIEDMINEQDEDDPHTQLYTVLANTPLKSYSPQAGVVSSGASSSTVRIPKRSGLANYWQDGG